MSLIVTTFKRDPVSGKLIDDPYPKNGKDIAGPESWRSDIWGADATIDMGAIYLPISQGVSQGSQGVGPVQRFVIIGYTEKNTLYIHAQKCNFIFENNGLSK